MPSVPRPAPREAALLAAVGAVLLVDGAFVKGNGVSVLGIVAILATLVVLAARTRAPIATVPAMVVAIAACLATIEPGNTVIVPGAIAAYAAAAEGDRRRSVGLIAVLVPAVSLLVLGFGHDDMNPDKLVSNVGIAIAAVLLGDGVRARRAARRAEEARRAQEDREREHDARARVAEERLRIARDVHDVVAHSIVAINVQAGVAAHLLRTRPENAEAALLEIKRVSGAALSDLRTTLGVLRADDDPDGSPLRPTDPLGRIDDLAEPLRAAGVAVDVSVIGDVARVPTAVGTAAFRIVQEALTNVLRHAGAAAATVRVAVGGDDVVVEVTDDGSGDLRPVRSLAAPAVPRSLGARAGHPSGAGDARAAATASRHESGGPAAGRDGASHARRESAHAGSGSGLRGMRERAATVGGSAEAGRDGDGGWTVRARLPLTGTGPRA